MWVHTLLTALPGSLLSFPDASFIIIEKRLALFDWKGCGIMPRENTSALVGYITDIQRYTIHDGPGIRTEIFFKGCPLHCRWCSNPETIHPGQQLGVYPKKCISLEKCGLCRKACPLGENSPIQFSEGALQPIVMTGQCAGCLACADACPAEAIAVWGKKMTVEELMKVILADRSFYARSGGGVTLNGGEVTVQWEFAAALARACHEKGINVCVESALHCQPERMEAVLTWADYVITDIKHMDSQVHKQLTGVGNELILENIRRVVQMGKPLVIRTPVVAGFNNSPENIRATAAFIRDELGGRILQYQLLPYRKMGTEKYETLGISYPMGDYVPPERAVWEKDLLSLRDMVRREFGIPAEAGSAQKWG